MGKKQTNKWYCKDFINLFNFSFKNIHPATIVKVLRDGYVIVQADDEDEEDALPLHCTSNYLYPVGHATKYKLPIIDPKSKRLKILNSNKLTHNSFQPASRPTNSTGVDILRRTRQRPHPSASSLNSTLKRSRRSSRCVLVESLSLSSSLGFEFNCGISEENTCTLENNPYRRTNSSELFFRKLTHPSKPKMVLFFRIKLLINFY